MSTIKTILCLLAILCAYGVVGRMDYEDAVMMENAYKQPAQTDCLRAVSHSSPHEKQPVHTNVTDEAVTDPADACNVQRY